MQDVLREKYVPVDSVLFHCAGMAQSMQVRRVPAVQAMCNVLLDKNVGMGYAALRVFRLLQHPVVRV